MNGQFLPTHILQRKVKRLYNICTSGMQQMYRKKSELFFSFRRQLPVRLTLYAHLPTLLQNSMSCFITNTVYHSFFAIYTLFCILFFNIWIQRLKWTFSYTRSVFFQGLLYGIPRGRSLLQGVPSSDVLQSKTRKRSLLRFIHILAERLRKRISPSADGDQRAFSPLDF